MSVDEVKEPDGIIEVGGQRAIVDHKTNENRQWKAGFDAGWRAAREPVRDGAMHGFSSLRDVICDAAYQVLRPRSDDPSVVRGQYDWAEKEAERIANGVIRRLS